MGCVHSTPVKSKENPLQTTKPSPSKVPDMDRSSKRSATFPLSQRFVEMLGLECKQSGLQASCSKNIKPVKRPVPKLKLEENPLLMRRKTSKERYEELDEELPVHTQLRRYSSGDAIQDNMVTSLQPILQQTGMDSARRITGRHSSNSSLNKSDKERPNLHHSREVLVATPLPGQIDSPVSGKARSQGSTETPSPIQRGWSD